MVANLVGRNVAVEFYEVRSDSRFLCERKAKHTSRKWTRPKSRRSETMVIWTAVKFAVRYSYTRLCQDEKGG